MIAKWLATRPKVIVLDEPTKGIDIGSKAAVHDFIGELAGEGLAVVLISSELPEVMGLADRVIVMKEGRIVERIPARRAGAPRRSSARRPARGGGGVSCAAPTREVVAGGPHPRRGRGDRRLSPVFVDGPNIRDVLTETSVLFMMALAQMMVS